jgi:predicted transcriptional regulator
LRPRTITVTSDSKPWKQQLSLTNDKEVYLLLLDREGRIAWMQHGDFTDKLFAELTDNAQRLSK